MNELLQKNEGLLQDRHLHAMFEENQALFVVLLPLFQRPQFSQIKKKPEWPHRLFRMFQDWDMKEARGWGLLLYQGYYIKILDTVAKSSGN